MSEFVSVGGGSGGLPYENEEEEDDEDDDVNVLNIQSMNCGTSDKTK